MPVQIPGVELKRFDPSNYYPEEQILQISDDLKQERLKWLAQFKQLDRDIVNALKL